MEFTGLVLADNGKDLKCPACGRYYHMQEGDKEKEGDPCPSDDCPSNED